MAKCELCDKGSQFGNSVSHSNRKTRRSWAPNVHRARVFVKGELKHMKVCTRCIRNQYKSSVVA